MKLRSIFLPACLALFACSSETTVNGGDGGTGGVSGGGGSPTGGGSGGTSGTGATGGGATGGTAGATGGTAGSGGSTPTGGTGGGGTGGTGGTDCDAGPIPCGVQVVASGVTKPYGLLVHDTGVYFTSFDNPGQVLVCAKTGCATPQPVASNQDMPKRMARYGTKMFWTNNGSTGSVQSCTLPCSKIDPVKTGVSGADHVAASPTHVFFTDSANMIHRCEHAGTGCTPLFPSEGKVGGLVYSAPTGNLYWSVPDFDYIKYCKATDCGAGQTNLVQGNFDVSAITTSPAGDMIFQTHNLSPSPLKRCAAAGCSLSPTDLIPNTFLLAPVSVAADDLNVYVLESTARVSRAGVGCTQNTCPQPETVASIAGVPGTVGLDDSYVYWTQTVGGVGYVLRKSK